MLACAITANANAIAWPWTRSVRGIGDGLPAAFLCRGLRPTRRGYMLAWWLSP